MAWRDLTDSPPSGDMLIVALEHKTRYNMHSILGYNGQSAGDDGTAV